MKKIIVASVLSLVLLLAFGLDAKAEEIAKEGTWTYTGVVSGTYKAIAMGEERLHITYEGIGVNIDDNPKSPLHNAAYHAIGAAHYVNGVLEDDRGFVVYTNADGDQAFKTTKGTGKNGGGIGKFVGGTGKLAGITGGEEWTYTPVRPAVEGTSQGIVKGKGHWKLP